MGVSLAVESPQTGRDMLQIFLVGLLLRLLLLYLFPVPYGEDAFGRIYFKDKIFLAHWLPLTQLLVYLSSRLTSEILLIRILFALLGSLAACGFYLFLRGIVGRRVAWQGGLLFTVNALFVLLSLMPYQDVLFLGLFYASLAFLVSDDSKAGPLVSRLARMHSVNLNEAMGSPQSGAGILCGSLLLGLACLTRYESWFLLPFLVLWEIRTMVSSVGLPGLPWTIVRVALFYGWAPLFWFALSWLHYGTWSGFLFQTRSGEFYAFNPHFDLWWMLEYGGRMLYWVGLFGSPVVLLSGVGLVRLGRRRQAWHPRFKCLLLVLLSVTVFFFVVIGKEQDTVFRFSAIPLSVLLVFVVFGWEGLKEWLQHQPRSLPLSRTLFSGPLLFVGLLAALALYAALPVAKYNSNPQFRDPHQVANLLKLELASGETAIILSPGSDDPAEAAPLAYQRVVAQSGWAAGSIRSARLIDIQGEQGLLDYSSQNRVRWLVVFHGFQARVAAERFYGEVTEKQPNWLRLTHTLTTASIYSVSAWPQTLEDFY